MNSSQLATQFAEVGQVLKGQGHLIMVRRARWYLNEGRTDLAAAFLLEASRRMPTSPIKSLSDALVAWRRNDGDLDALLEDATWTSARSHEDALSQKLAEASQDQGYSSLLTQFTEKTDGVAPELPSVEILTETPPQPWVEEEPTSEVFEAPSRIYVRPSNVSIPQESAGHLSDELVAAVIIMLQALTIYFCFFRSF